MNNKGNIKKAYKQFAIDLQKDKEFQEFKQKAFNNNFGCVVAGTRKFLIEGLRQSAIIPQMK